MCLQILRFCGYLQVFSMKFGHVASFDSTSEKFVEVFSYFQPIHVIFSCKTVPLYSKLELIPNKSFPLGVT